MALLLHREQMRPAFAETSTPHLLCSYLGVLRSAILSISRALLSAPFRLEARLEELDALVSDPKLYDDSVAAGKVVKERAKVESKLEAVKGLASDLQTWREMHGERKNTLGNPHHWLPPGASCSQASLRNLSL